MAQWWQERPMRLIQTNLREIDAGLDLDAYLRRLREFAASAVLFNVGGILANYPTDLPFHYRNPHLRDDLVGKVLAGARAEGIRFITRFDFSKVNEAYLADHPDWLYRNAAGQHITYNGQVQTCVNGEYQQRLALRILDEVLDRYPIDGVFFNMIGYVTRDYSGVYHGICQCDNCRARFRDAAGMALPAREDGHDLVFRRYERFKHETSRELFERIARLVKGRSAAIAVCTYTADGVDIIRSESNTGIDRPLPEWNYSASQNVKTVLHTWPEKGISNAAVHFVDFPFRHAAVSPHLTALRLAQNLANAGGPDYYVIGTLDDQDDRRSFPQVREIFQFHQRYERYYTGLRPVADACLIAPAGSAFYGSMAEFKGLYRILAAAHVLFDVLRDSLLDGPAALDRLAGYRLVVLPDVRALSPAAVATLDRYVAAGGKLLMTGATATCDAQGDPLGRVQLACAGVRAVGRTLEHQRGTYLRVRPEDKAELRGFDDLDILYLDSELLDCDLAEESRGFLAYIPPAMFGPPEKCYYPPATAVPGLVLHPHGAGWCAFLPWVVGRHYERLSHHGHAQLVESVLDDLLGVERGLTLDAPPLVEVTSHREREGAWRLVHLVNLSGQLGTAFHPPLPLRDIRVRVAVDRPTRRVAGLRGGAELAHRTTDDGRLEFTVPELGLFEAVLIE